MSEVAVPALEGKVIERAGTKVSELIEKLREMDPDAFVLIVDGEYGPQVDFTTREQDLDRFDLGQWDMKQLGIEPGVKVVMIG